MKKVIVFLSLLLLTLPALGETPSAQITSLNGQALIVTKEQRVSASPLITLPPRTLLELRGGTTMTVVFYESDSIEEYTGPALIGIGEKRGKVFKGAATSRKVVKVNSELVGLIDPNALVHPAGSGHLTMQEVSGKAKLSWTTDLPAPYQVSVVKPTEYGVGQTTIWSKDVNEKSVIYDGPKLDSRLTYFVEVNSGTSTVGVSQFRVHNGKVKPLAKGEAEADGLKLMDSNNTTGHVLLSILYTQHGLNQKAVEELNEALKIQPQEKAFESRMKTMVAGLDKKANKDTAYATGYYQAQQNMWGTDAYFDPGAWSWDGWDF